jgi:hypothetical protein
MTVFMGRMLEDGARRADPARRVAKDADAGWHRGEAAGGWGTAGRLPHRRPALERGRRLFEPPLFETRS